MTPEGKTVYLVRHADAAGQFGTNDIHRPLSPRGRADAARAGRRIKAAAQRPDLVLCSTACRAVETLAAMRSVPGVMEAPTEFTEAIYEATGGELLELLKQLDDRIPSAMLIGHNPAISRLASLLSGKPLTGLPTCTVVEVRTAALTWNSLGASSGRLARIDFPDDAHG